MTYTYPHIRLFHGIETFHYNGIISASESEDESATEEKAGEAQQAVQVGRPAISAFPDMPERLVTRGSARDLGILVPDIQ